MKDGYFLKMIQTLRQQEEIMLYGSVLQISEKEAAGVTKFLESEYQQEVWEYPGEAPAFDAQAALWAAKTVYTAAQLMLYRENKPDDLVALLPSFQNNCTAVNALSADLCLRFLPNIIVQLKLIDSEDELIHILENILLEWHYSGINYPLEIDSLSFDLLFANNCLRQLYIDKIIAYKKLSLAMHAACKPLVTAQLGIFTQTFWNDFKIATTIHE